MKKIFAISLVLLLVLSGCTQQAAPEIPEPEPVPKEMPEEPPAYLSYSDDSVSFDYPDWPDATIEDENLIMLKSDGNCIFSVGKYKAPSSLMQEGMERDMGAVFDGEYATYIMDPEGIHYNAKTKLSYCNYDTYTFSMMCPGEVDSTILSTAQCHKRNITMQPGLGLMPIPTNDSSELIVEGFKNARANGAEVLSWYLFWGPVANNWTLTDHIMEPLTYEGKSMILMSVIYVNLLGEFPPHYESFEDPGFKEEFAEFSVDFVERYEPDYYFIGGEVEIYLNAHRDEIPAYKELLAYTYKEIKKARPETQVGFVSTYHYSTANNATDIIQTLAPEVDLIGYTVHPYEQEYSYKNVSRGLEALEDVKNVVPGKPYAIVETGWSSSSLLESSEEKQVEFLYDFFQFYESSDAEFIIWFSFHELSDCSEAAERHLDGMDMDPEYVERFEEFMCSSGLKRTDGTPKKSWTVWQEHIKE